MSRAKFISKLACDFSASTWKQHLCSRHFYELSTWWFALIYGLKLGYQWISLIERERDAQCDSAKRCVRIQFIQFIANWCVNCIRSSEFHLIGRESESERARDSALGKIRLIKKNYLRAYYVSALAENIWLIREKREETRNDRDRDRKNSMHISRNMIYLNICHKKRGTNYNAHAFERLMMWCWFYFKCSSIIFAEWLLFTSDIIVHRI